MKSSITKIESIFTTLQSRFNALPDIQQTVILGAIAATIVFSVFSFKLSNPDTSVTTYQFKIKSEQEIKLERISNIKNMMDDLVIPNTEKLSKMVDNIKDEHEDLIDKNFVTDFKTSKFRSLSIANDTYSKELCESYNSVSFCAELKVEFVSNINMKADSQIKAANSQIKAANSEREEALSKLEN